MKQENLNKENTQQQKKDIDHQTQVLNKQADEIKRQAKLIAEMLRDKK